MVDVQQLWVFYYDTILFLWQMLLPYALVEDVKPLIRAQCLWQMLLPLWQIEKALQGGHAYGRC